MLCYFRFVFVPTNCFFLNPCFIFPENLILSFIDNVTTRTKSLALLIWNVALAVYIAAPGWKGGLASRLANIIDVIDIWNIIHSFDHNLKGTTASMSKVLLSSRVFPIVFFLYSKDLLVIVLMFLSNY